MHLNMAAIEEALAAQPLCAFYLKDPTPDTQARCAVGALLHGIGVTDEELTAVDNGVGFYGETILARWGEQLREKYGVESEEEIRRIMAVNDRTVERQHGSVADVVEALRRLNATPASF